MTRIFAIFLLAILMSSTAFADEDTDRSAEDNMAAAAVELLAEQYREFRVRIAIDVLKAKKGGQTPFHDEVRQEVAPYVGFNWASPEGKALNKAINELLGY